MLVIINPRVECEIRAEPLTLSMFFDLVPGVA
jgi:hypothetical protein